MPTIRTVAPAYEPVTLAQAKLYARADTGDDDALFTGIIIPGVREQAEQELQRAIMLQTWRKTLDRFPACGQIQLPWPNLLTVSSVQYRDTAGTWQTLDAAAYTVDADSVPGRVMPLSGTSWPSTYSAPGSVKVTYTAGYASGNEAAQQAAVPASVKLWIAVRLATAYEHREELIAGATVASLPNRFHDSMLDRERVYAKADSDENEAVT